MPSQAGQAPCGELKEKSRGSISGMVKPETGQANFWLREDRFGGVLAGLHDELRLGKALGQGQRGFETVGQSRFDSRFDNNAVDDDADIVLELLVELRRVLDGVDLSVDLHPLEAGGLPLLELLAILALAAAHDGGEQHQARSLRQGHQAVDHLADLLRFDGKAGGGRIGDADARPEEAHIVVDLRDGRDGRARVLRRGLLLDGDGGGQPLDVIDVGLLHHLEELARIGGEQFDVAALTLRIDGVEGERGFAGAGEAGDDDHRIARQVDVDVLQIMLARTAHADGGQGHGQKFPVCS